MHNGPVNGLIIITQNRPRKIAQYIVLAAICKQSCLFFLKSFTHTSPPKDTHSIGAILTKLCMYDHEGKCFHCCSYLGDGLPNSPTRGKFAQTSKFFFDNQKMIKFPPNKCFTFHLLCIALLCLLSYIKFHGVLIL